uniref:Uncharacterized protein LOC111101473 isoform X1 n=1 Tax=Crassostrea virginica TaxID=6565 RepID=A0A8B8ADY0_CRAVI|nr:uncharacterized protein LOC111101473 isoform X1 [Crassostrea virginica]
MIYKHKKTCMAAEGSTDMPVSLSTRNLADKDNFSEEYKTEILESFRETEYGNLIRNDEWIKHYGYFLYENLQGSCKKVEKRLSLNSKLRRLAHLFIEFKKVVEERKQIKADSCSEMFNIDHYEELKIAIANMTRDKETGKMKNGLKLTLKYLVKDVCDAMHVFYLKKKDNQKAADLGNYMLVLSKSWSSFFKNAEESVITKRLTELRAPVKLPSKSDIIKLRDCTKSTIQDLTGDSFCLLENADFCKLRDALVCRLTLFNARRGGEPSRMVLSELTDALEDKWIDQCRMEFVKDDIEKKLLCDTKVAYLHASKIAKLVPVLIPKDCWKALNVLVDTEVRRVAGVHTHNDFVFPNTKNSMGHVIGWDCVDRMSQEAGLEGRLNATGMRHFIATEYALLDVAPRDRELFYKHMGHSEAINENIYQCPPAVREITHVGKILANVDSMNEDADNVKENSDLLAVNDANVDILKDAGNVKEISNVVIDVSDANVDILNDTGNVEESSDVVTAVSDANVDILEEFIGLMAEDVPTFHIFDLSKQVDEFNVTVDVTKLIPKKELVLNKSVQESAKKFFTPDAWIAVQQTLQILKGKVGEKCRGSGSKRKVEATNLPEKVPEARNKMFFGESSSMPSMIFGEPSSGQRGQSMIVSDSSESEFQVDHSSSEEEDDSYPITKDEIKALIGSTQKVKPCRHTWSSEEHEAVQTFFKKEIEDVSTTGNKGKLHIGRKMYDFLKIHPEVLKDYPKRERIAKVRTKIINLRRQNRERYQRNLDMLT